MTDDTSQPPAPQPGWVATVSLTAKIVERNTITAAGPGGELVYVGRLAGDLDWQPPPPPPWEPEVGGLAMWKDHQVSVLALDDMEAWVLSLKTGGRYTATLSDLSPPKGGA